MNFLLLHGRGHRGSCYDYTEAAIKADNPGHGVFAPDLEISTEGKNFDTHAQQGIDAIDGLPRLVVGVHSRAGNIGPRIVNKLIELGRADDVLCLVYFCPSIPYAINQQHLAENEPPKYLDIYKDTIVDLSSSLTIFNPDRARQTLYNDCPAGRLDRAIDALRPHNIEDENVLPIMTHPDVPTHVYIGLHDRALNPNHIAYRSINALNVEPKTRRWDHTPQYSYPEELAQELIWCGRLAIKARQEDS